MPTVISLVSYPFLPAISGGQKMIALFNKYFSRHCRMVCITTKGNVPGAAEGYPVIDSIRNSPLRYINIFLFFYLYKIIKKEQATHLILAQSYYGWLGLLLKWATGIRIIIHSHNIESTRWKSMGKWWWRILAFYEKHVHRNADYNFFAREEDRLFAVNHYRVPPHTCITITYGIEWDGLPADQERLRCREELLQAHGISPDTFIFLFNGSLNYAPNLKALDIILEKINPYLLRSALKYKVIVCGGGLPADREKLQAYRDKNIVYAGFVEDIGLYFKGAGMFINPVNDGGGIKTKLVEALGYNLDAVSTESGAAGVSPSITANKMHVVGDEDWEAFAEAMIRPTTSGDTPAAFFTHFSWANIAAKAFAFISA